MNGKLLFVLTSGPGNPYNTVWGLRMARNTWIHPYGDESLQYVKVLLFGNGVSILSRNLPDSPEFFESLRELKDAGVKVFACVSIAEPLGLREEADELGVELVHASQFMIEHVNQNYSVINF